MQPVFDVAVSVALVPIGIPVIVFSEIIPAELVTAALLEKLTE